MTEQSQDGKKNIVIIGGGIIGCTSAYYLTRHPRFDPSKHTITLLEASSIAGGASGKAGGLLGLWAYPSSLVPLSYRLHKELADEHAGQALPLREKSDTGFGSDQQLLSKYGATHFDYRKKRKYTPDDTEQSKKSRHDLPDVDWHSNPQ